MGSPRTDGGNEGGGKLRLCLDWDGTCTKYKKGWAGSAATIDPDEELTEGLITFLRDAVKYFEVHIYSSRSHQEGGIAAMQGFLSRHMQGDDRAVYAQIKWPTYKPSAFLSYDDRTIQFEGRWPRNAADLLRFKPWNKRDKPKED